MKKKPLISIVITYYKKKKIYQKNFKFNFKSVI